MRLLNSMELTEIAGGLICTCEEALMQDAINWDIDDITKFCTKNQYTAYALGMIDLIYSQDLWNLSFDEAEYLEIEMIKNLTL